MTLEIFKLSYSKKTKILFLLHFLENMSFFLSDFIHSKNSFMVPDNYLFAAHEDFNSLIIMELIFVPSSAEIEMFLLPGSATA